MQNVGVLPLVSLLNPSDERTCTSNPFEQEAGDRASAIDVKQARGATTEAGSSIEVPPLGCDFPQEAVLSSKLDRVFAFDPGRQVGEDEVLRFMLVAPIRL